MNGDEQEGPAAPARTWPGYVLGAYALICGALAVVSARVYPHGWAVITVPALGCVGVMAGVMLLLRDGWWKPLLQLWLLAQAAVVIVDTSGPLTRQPGLHINYIRFGAVTSSGPLLLDYTGWGINFAAVILLVLVWVVLSKRWYPAGAGPWLNRIGALFEIVFLVAMVAGCAYAGLRWARPLLNKDALMVIDSPPPGAGVWLKDKFLGWTPLAVTQEKLLEWGLSKPGVAGKCAVSRAPLESGLLLQGSSATGELLFKPPDWLAADYVTAEMPWGFRGLTPIRTYYTSNYWSVPLLSKEQPGLVLGRPVIEPSACKPGEPVKIAVQMWRNADDPRLRIHLPEEQVQSARLSVLFWRQITATVGSTDTTNLDLPPAWAHLAVGQTVSNTVTLSAPRMPGTYTIRLACSMRGATNQPVGFEPYFSFGLLNVK